MALRDCNDDKISNLLNLFKCLSNPTRLQIARMICMSPRYSFEIEEFFNCDRSNITKHLNVLKKTGIIEQKKEGRKTLYIFKPQYMKSLMECLDQQKYIEKLDENSN